MVPGTMTVHRRDCGGTGTGLSGSSEGSPSLVQSKARRGYAVLRDGGMDLRRVERMFDTVLMTDRPAWWQYPTECHHGHEWGPGLVTVGWTPCDCPEAKAEKLGHLYVRCRAVEGCSSIWYRPAHSPQQA